MHSPVLLFLTTKKKGWSTITWGYSTAILLMAIIPGERRQRGNLWNIPPMSSYPPLFFCVTPLRTHVKTAQNGESEETHTTTLLCKRRLSTRHTATNLVLKWKETCKEMDVLSYALEMINNWQWRHLFLTAGGTAYNLQKEAELWERELWWPFNST